MPASKLIAIFASQSFGGLCAGNNDCGSMSWPRIGSVVVKGVPLHARVMHVQAGPSSMTSVVATEQASFGCCMLLVSTQTLEQ